MRRLPIAAAVVAFGLSAFGAIDIAAEASVRSNAWSGAWFDVEPGAPYVFSCDVDRGGSGAGVVYATADGVTMFRDARDGGTFGFTNAFISAFGRRKANCTLRKWNVVEDVVFRNVRLTKAVPRYRRIGGAELGFGESLDGNAYRYGTRFSSDARTHSRPLSVWRGGECNGPVVFWKGTSLEFAHEVAGRTFLSGSVGVALDGDGDAGVTVSLSRDGADWTDTATFAGLGAHRVGIPAALLPAERLFARVRKTDSGKGVKVRQYSFDATVDGPPAFGFGATEFLDAETGRRLLSMESPAYLDDASSGFALPGAPGGVTVWAQSAGRKVFRGRPAPVARADALRISAAGNEAESAQFVIRPEKPLKGVRVEAEMPEDIDVDIRRVGYVLVDLPMDTMGARGLWPDPIFAQGADGCDIAANENQPFWVTARPRKGTKPGVRRGTLKVTAKDGCEPFSVPVEVRVFGFDFPDAMTCETAFGLSWATVFRYHHAEKSADKAAIAAKYLDFFSRHHVTPYAPWHGVTPGTFKDRWTRPENPADAAPEFDWDAWDAAVSNALCNLHLNTFSVSLRGLGSSDPLSRRPRKIRSINGVGETNALYEVYMERYLKAVEAHLREKGWLGKAYVYAFDEPERSDYGYMKENLERLKRYAPSLRRMVTVSPRHELEGAVGLWCPITGSYDREKAWARIAAGDGLWWYITFSSKPPLVNEHIEHSGVDMRVWLWQTWMEKVQGVLIWETVYWNSRAAYPDPTRPQNPYEDAMAWSRSRPWNSGEGRFAYPPPQCFETEAPVIEGPVDSIRFEMLREGIEDYEYFAILKKLDPENGLLAVPPEVANSLRDYSADPASMEEHRGRLAYAIEGLKGE